MNEMTKFIVEPFASDGHMNWEIDLPARLASRRHEGSDDEWTITTFPLRRLDGKWQYYEGEEAWKQHVAGLADELERTRALSGHPAPPSAKALLQETTADITARLADARSTGPSWIDLPSDVSAEIEKRWTKQQTDGK